MKQDTQKNNRKYTFVAFPLLKLKQTFFIKYFWKQIKEQGILFFIMEIRERDNNLLYGVSPWRLLSGYLPQNKDVDLCVESYIYEGYSEKEAANFTACDLIRKYSVLTSSIITKKSLTLFVEFWNCGNVEERSWRSSVLTIEQGKKEKQVVERTALQNLMLLHLIFLLNLVNFLIVSQFLWMELLTQNLNQIGE